MAKKVARYTIDVSDRSNLVIVDSLRKEVQRYYYEFPRIKLKMFKRKNFLCRTPSGRYEENSFIVISCADDNGNTKSSVLLDIVLSADGINKHLLDEVALETASAITIHHSKLYPSLDYDPYEIECPYHSEYQYVFSS